jgi:nicotinamidase-related amidase
VAAAVGRAIQGASILGVPMLATEQYPKGVGRTVAEVAQHFPPQFVPIQKMTISCCDVEAFMSAVEKLGRQQVLLVGIETHACVIQTGHDLMHAGHRVHVAYDATSSRRVEDYVVGWGKMVKARVIATTVETALLELLRSRFPSSRPCSA